MNIPLRYRLMTCALSLVVAQAVSGGTLGTDKTQTNIAGAQKIAGFVADAIKSQKIGGLSQYLRN